MDIPKGRELPAAAALLPVVMAAAAVIAAAAGCGTAGGHMWDEQDGPLPSLEPLWEIVDGAFPGALPDDITVELINRPYSGFDIRRDSVKFSRAFSPEVARGKICMGLTHLALNRLSGGDRRNWGRCFDNDVRFLEYALASYMDRKFGGRLQLELPHSYSAAARLIQDEELTPSQIRDWDAFFYRGRLWADQYEEWNHEGLSALLTLGVFLVEEKMWRPEDLGRVFERLDDGGMTLDAAFLDELGAELNGILREWREHVLERASRLGFFSQNPEG